MEITLSILQEADKAGKDVENLLQEALSNNAIDIQKYYDLFGEFIQYKEDERKKLKNKSLNVNDLNLNGYLNFLEKVEFNVYE